MSEELDEKEEDDSDWKSCKQLIKYQINQHTTQIEGLSEEIKQSTKDTSNKIDSAVGEVNKKVDQLIKDFIEVRTAFNITVMGKGGIGGIIGSAIIMGVYLLIKHFIK